MTHSPLAPWWLPIAIAAFSLLITGYVGFTRSDRDVIQRLSVVEAHSTETTQRLDRMEDKIDKLMLFLGAKP